MDDHTQFLAPPPVSSPLLGQQNPSSKLQQYASYAPQHPYSPQSSLDSPSFYSNPAPSRPSSTQYHAQAPEPYDPQSFTFGDPAAHVQPLHTPLSENPSASHFTTPSLLPPQFSSPQHTQLGFVNLASHPHAQHNGHRATTISPPPPSASSPSPRSAGSSQGRASFPRSTTTSTSITGANARSPSSPRNSSSAGAGAGGVGPIRTAPSNGNARRNATNSGDVLAGAASTRSPTYAQGPTRVHPSLLPPTLWMSPTNPAPGSRPGFAKVQQTGPAPKRQPPPLQQQLQSRHLNEQYGNQQQQQQQQYQPHPLSQEQMLSPSSSITTNTSLISTSLGFGGTHGGRDSSVPTTVMSAIDEDEHERERGRELERKRALSIVPSSSFSNFDPAGFADAHSQDLPPLSAISGVSASAFSDLLSEAGAGAGIGIGATPGPGMGMGVGMGVGEADELSPEELQREDPLATQVWRLYARTKANLPHAQRMENLTWRMMGMALRRKLQLEAQMHAHQYHQQHQQHQQHQHQHQQHQHQQHQQALQYPYEQMQMPIKMKEEDEEHKVEPVDDGMDVPSERERGRRTQKFGGGPMAMANAATMARTSAPTITRGKAKMRVEGFELSEDTEGDGCVFFDFYLFSSFYFRSPLVRSMISGLMVWLGT